MGQCISADTSRPLQLMRKQTKIDNEGTPRRPVHNVSHTDVRKTDIIPQYSQTRKLISPFSCPGYVASLKRKSVSTRLSECHNPPSPCQDMQGVPPPALESTALPNAKINLCSQTKKANEEGYMVNREIQNIGWKVESDVAVRA